MANKVIRGGEASKRGRRAEPYLRRADGREVKAGLDDVVDEAYAADAVNCARDLLEWAKGALELLSNPGYRPSPSWDPDPARFTRKARAVRRAWIAANVVTDEPRATDWREFVTRVIREQSFHFDPRPEWWPKDKDERAKEEASRSRRAVANVRRIIASVDPDMGAKLVDEHTLCALHAHHNPRGRGNRAPLKKREALDIIFDDLGVPASDAAATRRRLIRKGRE